MSVTTLIRPRRERPVEPPRPAPAPAPQPAEPSVPPGYTLLPAGVTRRLRVNSAWLHSGSISQLDLKPFFVFEGERAHQYADVQILGPSRMVCEMDTKSGCGPQHSAWVETEAPLAVR